MITITIFKYLSNLMADTERACSVSSCLSKSLPNHILLDQENHLKQIKLLPKNIAFVKQDSSCQYNTNTVGHAPLIHLWKLGEDCYGANNAKFIPFSSTHTLSFIPCRVSPHFDPAALSRPIRIGDASLPVNVCHPSSRFSPLLGPRPFP